MCDQPGGCEAVHYDGDDIVIDLACGDTFTLEIQDYETDEPLPSTFDGGGTKLWLADGRKLWVGVV